MNQDNAYHILEWCNRLANMLWCFVCPIIVLAVFGGVYGKGLSVGMISVVSRAGMMLSGMLMEQRCQNERNQIKNRHRYSG